jgi:hypothetical protein
MADKKQQQQGEPGKNTVPISTLDPAQLEKIRSNIAQELEIITQNYGSLKLAMSRFGTALEALGEFKPENESERPLAKPNRDLSVFRQASDGPSDAVYVRAWPTLGHQDCACGQ